jgi:hypothetical protein
MATLALGIATARLLTVLDRMPNETPGEYLRRLMNAAGKSTRDVARESEGMVSHGYVATLLTTPGKWSGVTLDTLEGLARGVGVNQDEFVRNILDLRRGQQAGDPLLDLFKRKNVVHREGRYAETMVPLVRGGFGYPYSNSDAEVQLVKLHDHFPHDPEPNSQKLIIEAMGFCMEPHICEGDEVLVTLNPDCYRKNKLVALDVPDEGISVKWLVGVETDGAIRVKQTNPRKNYVMPLGTRIIGCVLEQHRPGRLLHKMLAVDLADS